MENSWDPHDPKPPRDDDDVDGVTFDDGTGLDDGTGFDETTNLVTTKRTFQPAFQRAFLNMIFAREVWRDYVTDGIPSSGKNSPYKPDIRRGGAWMESIITAFTSNGGLICSSLASLNADLVHGANLGAWRRYGRL